MSKTLTVKLDKTLYDSVLHFCTEHDLNISQTVRRALRDYISVQPSNTKSDPIVPSITENKKPALNMTESERAKFAAEWGDEE